MFYTLIGLIAILVIVLITSYAPTKPRTHCRCGAKADIIDHERPWIVWCGACHVKHLLERGEIL
jgi:hypothetical protein